MKEVAEKEAIKLGSVSGLGSVNDVTVGVFDIEEKKFYPNHFYFHAKNLKYTTIL